MNLRFCGSDLEECLKSNAILIRLRALNLSSLSTSQEPLRDEGSPENLRQFNKYYTGNPGLDTGVSKNPGLDRGFSDNPRLDKVFLGNPGLDKEFSVDPRLQGDFSENPRLNNGGFSENPRQDSFHENHKSSRYSNYLKKKLVYHERQVRYWIVKWNISRRAELGQRRHKINLGRSYRNGKWFRTVPRLKLGLNTYWGFYLRRKKFAFQRKCRWRALSCCRRTRRALRRASNISLKSKWRFSFAPNITVFASSEEQSEGIYTEPSHATQTSTWLPPLENWETGGSTLPYGWEVAIDKEGKSYFINHLTKSTTYEDPRREMQEDPPQPRQIDLLRDPDMGFGFVAGSEKPVIVRFVTDNGPSVDKLLPGDQILFINGEDVKRAPRDHVIQLVRSCKEKVSLTVCQPPLDNSERKSALLSAAKKQKLKSHPSRVRFAESVDINGSASPSQISSSESTTPFMPNVLKVFLENGQTKSFKYDSSTTVGDVLESLHQKLGIKCPEHFSLVVEHVKSLRRNKLTLLEPKESLSSIASRPGAQLLRCLYRITFVPKDAYDLLRKDSVAFEYLYLQCCNDVIQERFSPELKYDVALRLAALHIHQHALSAGGTAVKMSIKAIEKEFGLERFVPSSLVDSMKRKELRKLLSHFMKLHGSFTAPGQKQLTALQAKLHYLKIISELPSYGAKCFSTNIMEGNVEAVLLISPRFGISQIAGLRNSMPEPLCDIEQVMSVTVTREDDISKRVELTLKHPDKENLVLSLEDRDSDELVLVLQGYYRLLTDSPLSVTQPKDKDTKEQVVAPPYHSRHRVNTGTWSYFNGSDSEESHNGPTQRIADFGLAPPYQHPPDGYQIPNGHIGGKIDDENGTPIVSRRSPYLDTNMNRTNSVYENAGEIRQGAIPPRHINNIQSTPTAIHEEKKAPYRLIQTENGGTQNGGEETGLLPGVNEARNVEVIRRVAEMQQMVEDAETYLSDIDGETTDGESGRPNSYGKLKHSDSLLLLTHGQKLLTNDELESEEKSGSDTDSQSTPSSSPAHKPAGIKSSGSSFGLHSPDNLPMDLERDGNNIKALIRQLEDNSGLPYTFAEGTLYLDPDIIDLTMIPPPITPDEDGAKMLPPQLNTPPTPFADRESLDKELKALERDVGDLRSLTNMSWREDLLRSSSGSSNTGASDTEDTMSLSSVSTSRDSSLSRNSTLQSAMRRSASSNGVIGGPGFTLAALRQLGINLGEGEDIDSYIANLTIPPPPEGTNGLLSTMDTRYLGADYDIAAYIIPPPPLSTNDHRSSDIIRRLYEAKEGISKMVGCTDNIYSSEKDNDINEVRVKSEQVPKEQLLPGKVASLQRHFETGNKARNALEARQRSLKMNRNKLSTFEDVTSTSSLRLNNSKIESESRLNDAFEVNNKMFRSFDSISNELTTFKGGDGLHGHSPPPLSPKVKTFGPGSPSRQSPKRPGTLSTSESNFSKSRKIPDDKGPPPPPRTPVTKPDPFGSNRRPGNLKPSLSLQTNPQNTSPTSLSKSASQGDISTHTNSNTILRSPSKSYRPSISNEDVRKSPTKASPGSKESIGSSNDSLNSSSSAATVKSLSSRSLDKGDDSPPVLPPRNSSKTLTKPPLPRSNSQEQPKLTTFGKAMRSPSPNRKVLRSTSPDAPDKPPAVPSRLKKPQSSPSTSPPGTLSITQRVKAFQKVPAPQPPQIPLNKTSRSPSISPKPQGSPMHDHSKPRLPSKVTKSPNVSPSHTAPDSRNCNGIGMDAPLLTSSPKISPKSKLVNGKVSITSELDDSLDSGSFDQDSLEETEEVEAMPIASREAYKVTVAMINESIKTLSDMIATCSTNHKSGGNPTKDIGNFQLAKDSLTSESRHFVTASKLFVKSATESEEILLDSLSKCIAILQKMVTYSQDIAVHTTTPMQTQGVIIKVRDVVGIYLSTVRAALSAAGRGMDHPSMNTLMAQATSLAGVLTALMRTLRVFSP